MPYTEATLTEVLGHLEGLLKRSLGLRRRSGRYQFQGLPHPVDGHLTASQWLSLDEATAFVLGAVYGMCYSYTKAERSETLLVPAGTSVH